MAGVLGVSVHDRKHDIADRPALTLCFGHATTIANFLPISRLVIETSSTKGQEDSFITTDSRIATLRLPESRSHSHETSCAYLVAHHLSTTFLG